MSSEPLQRQKQINKPARVLWYFFPGSFLCIFFRPFFSDIFFCSEFWAPAEAEADQQGLLGYFYIFFSGRFFWAFFLGHIFWTIFSVLSSEPLQWQAEADQRGLVGSFDIRRTALIMHCTSWVNCDELLSSGKYHLHIAEQIWIYPTQGKCFGQTCKTFWILNKTQSKPLSSFCMLVLWRQNCVLGNISLLSSKVAVAFEGLDFSDEKFNHSWSLSWPGPVQVFDGWHEICRRAPLKNTCLTMKLGVRQQRTVTLLSFKFRKKWT